MYRTNIDKELTEIRKDKIASRISFNTVTIVQYERELLRGGV